MVQDVKLVANLNISIQQIANGPHDSGSPKVAAWIVVTANDQQTSVVALHCSDQVVQILEIVVVSRQ